MPSAKSAATSKPHAHTTDSSLRVPDDALVVSATTGRRPRIWTLVIGAALGASLVLPGVMEPTPVAVAAAQPNGCSGWTSTSRPPNSIRVLRRKTGRVVRVPFRHYVVTVMGKEWPSYLPQAVVEAGAVAVKQYGWYHALGRAHRSQRGQCFDVTDGISDQLYKPGKARVRSDHYAAVRKTWNVRLLKNGRLFMTGYRRGSSVRCGRDHTGYKLYARSASKCARRGYNYLQILRRYYGPRLDVVNGGGSGSGGRRSAQVRSSSGQIAARENDRRPPTNKPDRAPSSRPSRRPQATRPTPTIDPTWSGPTSTADLALELIARRGSGVGVFHVYVEGARVGRVGAIA